jgi:hypothetical protein
MRSTRFVVAALAAVCTCWATASSASATPLLKCGGKYTITSSPGLTETPPLLQINTAHYKWELCENPSEPSESRTGSHTTVLPLPLTCKYITEERSEVRTISWSTLGTSVWSLVSTAEETSNGSIVLHEKGTIVLGEFVGHEALGTATIAPGTLAACAEPGGLTEWSGPQTLEIL